MKLRSVVTPILFFYLVAVRSPAQAATPSKVVMTTGSLSEREAALYIAQEQGLFRRYGLDVSLVQVRNGPVGMSALSSGETQFHWGSVSAANLGAIAEGADLVFVAGFINKLTGNFIANPKIKSPAELRGKSLGVNSLSGGGWIFTMLMLDLRERSIPASTALATSSASWALATKRFGASEPRTWWTKALSKSWRKKGGSERLE
ncbi:MAG: hypothetical protein DME93_11580 [Verrucomicrobia bacterium]|nr:MAG: hypothetical protein DME93_11580 [Verrucomicrobiota bacterium]